ncbi:diguanylate cyclase domain-containing protein [Clostridium saccharobutylicum]|uniref:Signaling protein n=2 Tax=Clostridium saccharobutylicum TaxID=169679 RepID=U5N005_CLOSA|nr:diguanylate cyclase [Clostridium saccharobutylicum]AGX45102.1 signaling protein [Clostridium saccharobutylicum DSM 13864]AQR92384.1 putative diguanylate cyclase YegE [Clostridium saccharobutylicum]AQS02287.1 putative diguanylate cyclase YegE [Clostridium saccharobutylicum]AQS16270.1 putative diguanylate cyclase YegE [Clostridium saccharobutylicum]MBA2904945.1 diguanylate cyclase (GGDEF)-like protein/PAS domain S-box-containing protein [Clostridium saccharobutylicum]
MNIRKKFVIFSVLLFVIPTCIATSISIENLRNKTIEIIKQNIITVADDQSSNLQDFFRENISNLNVIKSMPITENLLIYSNNKTNPKDIKKNVDMLNEFLISTKEEYFYLNDLAVINKEELVIADSNNERIGQNIMLSDNDKRKLLNNQIVVTNIIERKEVNNGIKSAIIVSPVFSEGKYEGSILNVIDMTYFKTAVDNIHFFKTGNVSIIDGNGKIAYSNNKEFKYSINRIEGKNNLYSQWKQVNFNNNPKGIINYNTNGVEKIGYYSRISGTDWIVFSDVQWNEFKIPLNENIKNIIITLLFIIVIATISYIFIMKHFFKPLFNLLESIKKIKQGDYSDRFIYDKDNEFGEISKAFNELISKIEKKRRYIKNKNRELYCLTSNIPGGVHRNIIKDGEHIVDFLTGGCLNLLGYKRHEFKKMFGRKIFDVIYEEDRERVEREINDQISKNNRFAVEYRIKRKDGSIVWILDNGRIVEDREGKIFSYNVTININDAKIAQEELRLSEERYRIIMSQTEEIIFEWNVKEDAISYSDNWQQKFNIESNISNISKKIYNNNSIYKDDLKELGKFLNDFINGEKYNETEIRIKNIDNEYIWCKIRGTAMFDQNDNLFKVIGVIININKEKIESEKLLFKAQRDSLTKLYNKGTVENIIKEYMENSNISNKHGALFIIDIDDFKSINDNMGHLVGDDVLSNVSSMFLNVFYENAIVGRIGGDEFIVFLKDIKSEKVIYDKADKLVNGFKAGYIENNLDYKVSGSIGIAKYPKDGESFGELFENADKALYLAKNKGKDNYCIFEKNI